MKLCVYIYTHARAPHRVERLTVRKARSLTGAELMSGVTSFSHSPAYEMASESAHLEIWLISKL